MNATSELYPSLEDSKVAIRSEAAANSDFLRRFEAERLTDEQLRRFAVQWYKTARGHKEAFPWLIANTRHDDVRFDLIEILREEYGNGDRKEIHSRLLWRFLAALGLSEDEVESAPTLRGVQSFSEQVLKVWRDGDPIVAFGLHFALEYIASDFHVRFANGVQKYDRLGDYERRYFEFHRIAEERHSDVSEAGWQIYASLPHGPERLTEGAEQGLRLMSQLWRDFDGHIFPCD